MAHDRTLAVQEAELLQVLDFSDKSSQEGASVPGEKHSPNTDRIEITHTQLSRGAALAVLIGFIMFLVGYTLGKQSTGEGVEFFPSLYTTFFEDPAQALIAEEKNVKKEYGRFATKEEADRLYRKLVRQGKKVDLVKRISTTASSKEYIWYQVG